ncbi:MAG: NAD(P)-dependent oxidoreductase [Gammaproteobacteria bacterium]|nr:NAD(P)-dependent oxidoreductase [Gammaproteobacteria bacterium]
MQNCGVIGLGGMGGPMAQRLHAAGLLILAWNRTRERIQAWADELDLPLADGPAAVAAAADVIILSVSRDVDVLAVIDQMLDSLRPGTVVIDTSTVSAQTARAAAARLATVGVEFLDAPVSGGVEGARNGKLSMMVGGDPAVLERVRPVLTHLAANVIHMGPHGAGQMTKAVNQIVVAGVAQGVCEALAFGRAAGLPMEKVIEVVSGGAAGNWFLDHRGPTMVRDSFAPGFRLSLHHKDLGICREMARDMTSDQHSALPTVEMTMRHYERLMDQGHGDDDISALFRIKTEALG